MNDSIYIEFLIEDESGKILLEKIMQKYCDSRNNISYRVHGFKGIGKFPKSSRKAKDIKTKRLLNDLPIYLKGFNRSLACLSHKKAIIVIIDNDDENCAILKNQLLNMLKELRINIETFFCIAIEEMEAWLLGDINAILSAYPNAKRQLLQDYIPDSIIGTWEYLANAVYNGGVNKLKKDSTSYHEIGAQKCEWASNIGSCIDLNENKSPSLQYFISKLNVICGV